VSLNKCINFALYTCVCSNQLCYFKFPWTLSSAEVSINFTWRFNGALHGAYRIEPLCGRRAAGGGRIPELAFAVNSFKQGAYIRSETLLRTIVQIWRINWQNENITWRSNENNSKVCGRERKAKVIDINRRDETPVMRLCDVFHK
jgi:hypothetical protein